MGSRIIFRNCALNAFKIIKFNFPSKAFIQTYINPYDRKSILERIAENIDIIIWFVFTEE